MRKTYVLFITLIILAVINSMAWTANIPLEINYQGQLSDTAGNAIDTTISIEFNIYADSSGGSSLWEETHSNVVVVGGLFNVALGSDSTIYASLFDSTSRWLGITVGGDSELEPRTPILSNAYTYVSTTALNADTASYCDTAEVAKTVVTIDSASGGYISSAVEVNGNTTFGISNTNTGDYSHVAGRYNKVSGDYAVVCGGGGNTAIDSNLASGDHSGVVAGKRNIASGTASFIGGGATNFATGTASVVCGGSHDTAAVEGSAVLGGYWNGARGSYSVVLGGTYNHTAGKNAVAAGYRAKANHDYSFVWADSSNADFTSSADRQFSIRAAGGTRIYSNSSITAGVTLAAGASAWASVSDRSLKRNIRQVDGSEILEKLSQLPICRWSYKAQDSDIEHVGPIAQDFYEHFGLGDDNVTISTIDPSGIALAAAKELYLKSLNKDKEIEELKNQLKELNEIISKLNAKINR